MQTTTLVSVFVLAAVMLLTAPQAANAACCHSGGSTCGDCTNPTPYCGYGPCNIFGCNCSGGCRSGRCYQKRSVDSETASAESIVSAGDLNGDGFLSVAEAESMLQQGPNAVHRRSVRSLDRNMDGLLTAEEIDN